MELLRDYSKSSLTFVATDDNGGIEVGLNRGPAQILATSFIILDNPRSCSAP